MPEQPKTNKSKNIDNASFNSAKLLQEKYNQSNDPKNPFSGSSKEGLIANTQAYLERKQRQLAGLRQNTDPKAENQSESDRLKRQNRIYTYLLNKLTLQEFPEQTFQNQLQATRNMGLEVTDQQELDLRDNFFETSKNNQKTELQT